MAVWSAFHSLILPETPGCPEVTVNGALAASAAEFCAETHIWRETLDPFNTAPGEALYDLDASAVVESVPQLAVDGRELGHVDVRQLDPTRLTDTGLPSHFWMQDDTQVRLFPIPDRVYPVQATATLKPSRAATGVPNWIYETFGDGIVSGALWRLLRIPGKEWTNVDLASAHKALFGQAVIEARVRDYRHVPLRVRPHSF